MNPLVSVVMPTWNNEYTLPKAIQSVLTQTFADFELIVVDDASTDSTPDVLSRYQMLDRRLVVVTNRSNSRTSDPQWEPRNDGLEFAKGEYVAYLDADNEWHRSFLEVMLQEIAKNEAVMLAHCDSINFYKPGELMKIVGSDLRKLVYAGVDCAIFSHDELDAELFGSGIYVDTNEMLHRKGIFDGIGGHWRIEHPNKQRIQMYQGNKFLYRRHNDLELFERVFHTFGNSSIHHVKRALVRFIYPNASSVRLYHDRVMDVLNDRLYQIDEGQ